jgi:hypothetical protein
MAQRKLTEKSLRAILNNVTFPDRTWVVTCKADGWMLQVSYYEEDIETGLVELQKSRKYYVSPFSTETEVVDTCFLCLMRSFEHVIREHFLYKGRRVQSPHFSMSARIEMCDRLMYDKRKPLPKKREKVAKWQAG